MGVGWTPDEHILEIFLGTSLFVQWLRICLSIQRTQIQSPVQEDSTCQRGSKPVKHNYSAPTLEAVHCHKRSPCSVTREEPLLSTTRESPNNRQQRPGCSQKKQREKAHSNKTKNFFKFNFNLIKKIKGRPPNCSEEKEVEMC